MALGRSASLRSIVHIIQINKVRLVNNVPNASYKSIYSLDKLYPESSLDMTKTVEPPKSTDSEFSGYIPIDKLKITYSCSSAPGGQHVNKVHTKVDLRFQVSTAQWIPEKVKPKILERYGSLITKEGFLVLKSERTRVQMLNVADCLDKLRFIIRDCLKPPPLNSAEKETLQLAREEKAARERLREKRKRSSVKADRETPS